MKRFVLLFVRIGLLSIAVVGHAETSRSDGLDIHWVAAGDGKTLIFVHGWMCDHSAWAGQAEYFSAQYQVVALDFPGHGLSGNPANNVLSLATYVEAIEAVRSDLGAEEVVLVGHSMGAPVISKYAQVYPEHVVGLVSVDGPPVNAAAEIPEQAPPPLVFNRQIREGIINSFFVESTSDELKAYVREMMLDGSDELAAALLAPVRSPENWIDLRVEAPLLGFVSGGTPLPDEETVKQTFPNSEFTKIEDTGHFLMMEKPQEFNEAVSGFLEEINF